MMKKILYFMLATILICGCKQEAPLTFQAGTYEVTFINTILGFLSML